MIKKIFFTFLFLLIVFSGNVNAQCSLTGNVNSSTRTCSSFSTCPIIYIGDGTTNTSLILNGNLDLTTCSLGPIQIIVNPNANIDFSDQNYDLRLPAGSSITFIGSGTLISPGGCSASDRIVIGGTVVANCLGSGPPLSFSELVEQGGFNIVNISPSSASACGSGSFSFIATAVPVTTGASGTVIKWYSAATGTSSLLRTGTAGSASDTYTTPPISATTTYYAEATTGSFTTPRKAVVATIKPLPTTPSVGAITQPTCAVATGSVVLSGLPAGNWILNPGGIAGNTASRSISGLASGTYKFSVTNASGCTSAASNAVVINAQPTTPAVPTVVVTASTCASAATNILSTYSASLTYTSTPTGLSVGAGGLITGGTDGTYYTITAKNASNCSATSAIFKCNGGAIFPTPAAPSVGTPTQPDCITPTGSVVLSGLPASGTINQTGAPSATITITGTTMTISGLASGTFNFTVSNGTCTSAATANVVINPAVTNTWNGSWNNGTPNSTQALIFAALYSSFSNVSGCSCQVNTGVNVTIKNPHTLTITNGVTVLGTGTLTFDYDTTFGANPISSASLVQINNVLNTGNIKYLRRTNTTVISTDYTYWSSPVSGQTMFNVSPNTLPSMFYSYQVTSTNENWQQESSGTTMAAGVGYIIGGPKVITPPASYLATFIGVPNNGTYPVSVFQDKSCLLGNPYPSAIDANTFLNENNSVLYGTLYFWTHNTAIQNATNIGTNPDGSPKAGSGAYAYTSDDYAVYNATGGTAATQPDKNALGNTYPSTVPTGNIAAGQGFFATAKATGKVMFNNTTRIAGNNTQFFKSRNPKVKTVTEKNRIWLNLTNTQGAFKQTLLGYVTDATNAYDDRFDGESFDGNDFLDFYSINEYKNLTIQGRALPFDSNDEIPFGYRIALEGSFTISIDETDGLLSNQEVFLEDKLANKTVNLKQGNYTFSTKAGTFDDRFVLRYTDKTLATTVFNAKENNVLVSIKNKKIQINSFAESIDKVTIYDLLGRQVYQKNKVNSNEFAIFNLVSSRQTLIVKTILQDGQEVSKKIIY